MSEENIFDYKTEMKYGTDLTLEFINLLKKINFELYSNFMDVVHKDTMEYYNSLEKIYVNKMLYMKWKRYQMMLIEMLNRCSPDKYYYGQCEGEFGYGYWVKKDYRIDNMRKLIVEEIYKLKKLVYSSENKNKDSLWSFLRDDRIEDGLKCVNDKMLLNVFKCLYRRSI